VIECLLAIQEEKKAHLEDMKAMREAWLENMEAKSQASQEKDICCSRAL
jgi:hypothetical protein